MYGLMLQIQHAGFAQEVTLNHEVVLRVPNLSLDLQVHLEVCSLCSPRNIIPGEETLSVYCNLI